MSRSSCRSLSTPQRGIVAIGSAGVGANPTVAVPARAARRFGERGVHHVGRHQWRIQAHRSGRGGAPLGRAQVQAEHELRQTLTRSQVRVKFYLIRPPEYIYVNLSPMRV